VLTRGGNSADGRARQRLTATAAGGATPARWRPGPGNKRKGKLRGILGKVGVARMGGESGRSRDSP
jgi:hypothetical protein